MLHKSSKIIQTDFRVDSCILLHDVGKIKTEALTRQKPNGLNR